MISRLDVGPRVVLFASIAIGACGGSVGNGRLADGGRDVEGVDGVGQAPDGGPFSSPDGGAPIDACATCTGECVDGRCLVTLATRQFDPMGIAVGASGVFWVNYARAVQGFGTVMGLAPSGGAPTTLVSGQNGPTSVALDAANVYWVNAGAEGPMSAAPGGVMRASANGPAGSTAIELAASSDWAIGIAVDATSVYWANSSSVVKVPLGGGKLVTLAADGAVSGLSLGGATLSWSSSAYDVIGAMPVAGGIESTIAAGPYPSGIAANDARLAWVDPLGQGTVVSYPLGGCTDPTVLFSDAGERFPTAIAVDETNAYWISSCSFLSDQCGEQTTTGFFPTDSLVMKAPLAGGPAVTLAAIRGPVSGSIAVDDTSVYWTDGQSFGTVRKLTPK